MRTPVEPHCHVQSLDSASTPDRFAQRELELGTGYITVTDHGTLEATRTVYDFCAPGGKYHGKLKPILGVEGYVRDDNCPILLRNGHTPKMDADGKPSFRDVIKYAHITLHACDEQAYFKLVKKLSDADLRAEQHGSERKPLFDWAVLEELGAENMTGTSGCLIGMVGRHLMQNNDVRSAVGYYERLRGLFRPGHFYVEMFPHTTERYYQSAVCIKLESGEEVSLSSKRKLRTAQGELYAEDLASAFKRDTVAARKVHQSILDVMENRKWTGKRYDGLVAVERQEGFVRNECKPWCSHGDYQLEVNRFLFALATKYGDKILVSGDSHFAYPEEHLIQDARLNGWRFAESHHRMSGDESFVYFKNRLGVSEKTFEEWTDNSYEWASRFHDFKFSPRNALPNRFYPADTLRHIFELIQKHGRMDWSNTVMKTRLKAEIDLLHRNGTIDLLPYFMVDEEVCSLYKGKGYLTGPGRGSAAGLLLTYLLGITHVNPLKYNLSMDRFMTIDRIASGKLPDIDQDLPFRDLLVNPEDPTKGWLAERFGPCVAQMSVDIQLKLKLAIKDTHRIKDGFVSKTIEEICADLPDPPQGIETRDYVFGYEVDGTYVPGLMETNKTLQDYIATYPEYWRVVQGLIGLPRQKGRHPCGFVISSEPIDTFIPMTTVGGVRVTSFTAASVEAMGGLKMDFLTVNSVGDIDRALKLIRQRHAPELTDVQSVPLDGVVYDIYNLPDDNEVYTDIAKGRVETVFQLDGGAARQGLRNFSLTPDGPPLASMEALSAFTALDRPGPLDAYVEDEHGNKHNMLVEFANRARKEGAVGSLPILDDLLPETHGVIVYQEQLQHIFQTVGQTTGIEANNFRQRIGKKKIVDVRKKDKPLFMPNATKMLGEHEAERLWGMMETFGQYGFNKSHSVCYMHTAYACAWLKHHYPLEWWTAVLTNADRKDVDEKFWRYCGPLVLMPDASKSEANFVIEGDKIRAPAWLIHGIGEKAHKLLQDLRPYSTIEQLLIKIQEYRQRTSSTITKTKDSGEVVQSQRMGHNPLGDGLMRKLIVCGVLDSLFPTHRDDGLPIDTIDRLSLFDQTAARVRGKKKIKASASKFNLSSEVSKYQYIKSVMPAYTAPLVDMFRRVRPEKFRDYSENLVYYTANDKENYGLLTGDQFDWLEKLEHLPETAMKIALPAYVVTQRVFKYQNGAKTACDLTIDIEGHRRQFVKWPSKSDGLPSEFKQPLQGALVVALFSRRKPTDSFYFQSIEIVAPPHTDEESPIND